MYLEKLRTFFTGFNQENEVIIHHKMELIKAIIEAKEHPEIAAIDFVNTGVMISMKLDDPHAAHDLASHLKEQADWINKRVGHLVSGHKTNSDSKH